MTATTQQPVAEICSASHDDAQFGERDIKLLRDISGFEYGTPLYAGAAPAAVAPLGEYPALPDGVMFIEQVGGDVIGRPTDHAFKCARGVVHGGVLFTGEQMRAYFDLGRQQPAAVAGPAPAGWRLVPAAPTRGWVAAVADDGYEDCNCAQMIASILSHAPAAPALEAPAGPALQPLTGREIINRFDFLEGVVNEHYYLKIVKVAEGIHAAALAAAPQAPAAPSVGNWIAAEEVDRLVRDLDVALHGEADAAPQASLCDIVGLVNAAAGKLGRPVLAAPVAHTEPVELDMDRVLSLADLHADESREDGLRLLDRGGLVALAQDVLRIFTPEAAPAAPAVDASGAVPVVLGKKLFQFSRHQDWVNRAQRAWKMAGVRSEHTICLDQKGRILQKGLEFARADKEGAFPVDVYLALVDDTATHDAWLAAQAAAKGAAND